MNISFRGSAKNEIEKITKIEELKRYSEQYLKNHQKPPSCRNIIYEQIGFASTVR